MAGDIDRTGTIVDWNDVRGFGFISDTNVSGRIFFHIKDVVSSIRPAVGDEVAYKLIQGRMGKPAARDVVLTGARAKSAADEVERQEAPMRVTIRIVGTLMLATAVVCVVVSGRAPYWFAACYVIGGIASFVAYRLDKRAAIQHRWRTKEGTLHLFDAVFGVGGGLLAQGLLRHKSSKLSFGIISAIIFALHMLGLGLLLAGYNPIDWLSWLGRQ